MDPIRLITNFVYTISRLISSPFYYLSQAIGADRVFNNFRRLRIALSQPWRYLRIPATGLQATWRRIQVLFGNTAIKIPGIGPYLKSFQISREDKAADSEYEELEYVHAIQVEKAAYSQIHLVHRTTQQRTIVHIGAPIGRTDSIINEFKGGTHPEVTLQFTQINAQRYNAPVLLEYLEGSSKILVDDVEVKVKKFAPIRPNSIVKIDHDEYTCELFRGEAMPPVARFDAGWITSAGPVRPYNEDAIGIFQHPYGYMFALADGVGGGEAGELISEFAIQYLLATFQKNVKFDIDWYDIYREAFKNINNAVRQFARQSEYATAGTTLTAVVVKGWDAFIAHIGDSRVYHYSGGTLRLITKDHSTTETIQPEGEAAEVRSEAVLPRTSRMPRSRSILARAIGKADEVEPDFMALRLQPGDRLLLCTDGLNDRVKDDELIKLLTSTPMSRLPEQLMNLANERYNSDNISIIALETQQRSGARDAWRPSASERVYVGFDPRWSLRLKPLPKPITRQRNRGAWLIRFVVALIVLGFAAGFGLLLGNQFALRSAANTLAHTTPITRTPTPIPTNTPRPTATITITPSPTVTPTPSPIPTSTLVPPPTSTLDTSLSYYNPTPRPDEGQQMAARPSDILFNGYKSGINRPIFSHRQVAR